MISSMFFTSSLLFWILQEAGGLRDADGIDRS